MEVQQIRGSRQACAYRGVVDVGNLPPGSAELVDEDGILQPAERQRPVAPDIPGMDGSCTKPPTQPDYAPSKQQIASARAGLAELSMHTSHAWDLQVEA